MSTKHVWGDGKLCALPGYAAVAEAQKHVEDRQLGDVDCAECLVRLAHEHAALSEGFRARLIPGAEFKKCRVYAAPCVNPTYCDARDVCCAGDPNCRVVAQGLCHECSEMVDIVDGKLSPHHGETGDGCPLNGADVQIYLHPRVAARLAYLEAALVFDLCPACRDQRGGPSDEA